ncbi:MAG: gamma carbonic anhydrase family protein [Elusimicrobia bacterium]|nr:gamma carbonic anhydrase family protein [Elusimicrobiota bacterium]
MIRSFNKKKPVIHPSAWVHPSAEVIGDVTIGKNASIWPMCVLRGDTDHITIADNTNVQDGTIIHCDEGAPTSLGRGITVGHRVLLHGARVADHVLLGMGSIILEAEIGPWCLIGAGSLVLGGMKIPPRSFVLGSPAKIIRKVNSKEIAMIRQGEKNYWARQMAHRKTGYPVSL